MRFSVLLLLIGFLFLNNLSAQTRNNIRTNGPVEYLDGEIIVKFKNNIQTNTEKKAVISSMGDNSFSKIKGSSFVTVKTSSTEDVESAIKRYQNNPDVEIAQPNYIYRISSVPNDPYYSTHLWGLKNTAQLIPLSLDGVISTNNPGTAGADINIEPAWSKITDCSSVVVAIIDTGVNYKHEDLADNMWNGGTSYPKHGYDFVNSDNDPMDFNGHGTHLAGIIGAVGQNAKDGVGVCWKANMMAIRALDENGAGYTSDIVQGIAFAIQNHARVINMSFGVSGYDAILGSSISDAEQAGVLVVAAAGNDGENMATGTKMYPCSYTNSNVICVAALDQKDKLASFSNYSTVDVDVGAPGVNVYSTWFANLLLTDNFSSACSGWNNFTGTIGSWACVGTSSKMLVSPYNWNAAGTNHYVNSSDAGVYKNFSINPGLLNSYDRISLYFVGAVDVDTSDYLNVYYSNSGNPMSGSPYQISEAQSLPLSAAAYSYSLPNCIGHSNCYIGFQLSSTAFSTTRTGIALLDLSIYGIKDQTSEYRIENGTSMATPYVTGLAAMLMAYNPSYTYAEVKNSILNGGRSVSSLSQKTVSGNSIDAWGSLTYINTPTGVTASVQ
ncbi:MAG: S8 family serine peptidase [bacterium]